jgi:hypothetical protein
MKNDKLNCQISTIFMNQWQINSIQNFHRNLFLTENSSEHELEFQWEVWSLRRKSSFPVKTWVVSTTNLIGWLFILGNYSLINIKSQFCLLLLNLNRSVS